ncbi:MAG: transporter substrate-binding domain-containing protein [Candidatus Didemnitutus sp.]|nr:transporter substrate-binding domain-containing protein [Candidatus Didemnitutus sp.]
MKTPLARLRAPLLGLLVVSAGLAAPPAGLPLSPAEQAWIAQHPVVRVGHLDGAAPYFVRDSHGEPSGLNVDYLALIAERTGLHFAHDADRVWSEIFTRAADGRLDLVAGIGRTPTRERSLIFGQPFIFSPDVIVTRVHSPVLVDMRQLDGLRVGMARSSPPIARAPAAQIVGFDNMRDAIRAVARGQVDAAMVDALVAMHAIKADGLSNVNIGVIYDENADVYLASTRRHPLLASIIDKALASITPEEHRRIRDRWLSVDYTQDRWWLMAFRAASIWAAFLTALALLFFLQRRRLARELAERRRIQRQLEEVRDRLAAASEEKSELMRMLVHDLRNPLASFVMGANLLRVGGLSHEQSSVVEGLRFNAANMTRLIDDLMDADVIESGHRRLRFTSIDLTRTLAQARDAFLEMAGAKALQLRYLPPVQPVFAVTDEGALRQIVDNLLSNAVKYSPPGRTIQLTLQAEAGQATIAVHDQGPGLAPRDIELLFRKFSRGPARPTGGEKSIGIGLWIVKQMTAALGGEIRCESQLGQGTRFILVLPLAGPPPTAPQPSPVATR